MSNVDLGPRKTAFIMVVVVGCFAVLWPKVFYPMYAGNGQIAAKSFDKSAGCCDVIWETDVNAINIMMDLCGHILEDLRTTDPRVQLAFESGKLPKDVVEKCRVKVLSTCNVDIALLLNENVKLGRTYRQILDELRSTNSSLCLKYNFGVKPYALGSRHWGTLADRKIPDVRQERPAHLRPDMLHPALRERGRMIPPSSAIPPSPSIPMPAASQPNKPRIVPGRPGPLPGMRPTMGGPGHVVQPSKQSTMGIVMPIYTIGIVIFFTYTLMKVRANREDLSFDRNYDTESKSSSPHHHDDSPEPSIPSNLMHLQNSALSAHNKKMRNYKKLLWVQKELEQLCIEDNDLIVADEFEKKIN